MRRLLLKLLPLAASFVFTGCAVQATETSASQTHSSRQTASQQTLYQELGGEAGLSAIVDGLLARIATDPRIVHHFQETDIALFRARAIEHFCLVADGGCVYHGESMAHSHRGLNITQADFDALVGHLIESMKEQHISLSTRNAFLKRLAPMYTDITYQ
jgi:hemoglobin